MIQTRFIDQMEPIWKTEGKIVRMESMCTHTGTQTQTYARPFEWKKICLVMRGIGAGIDGEGKGKW